MYNELIDALRNCACIKNEDHCKMCGYRHSTECGRRIADDAADAIERLIAEVDRKDKTIERMRDLMRHYKAAYRTAYKLYQEARHEQQP